MSNNIYDMVMDELKTRGTLGYETYAPPFVCSYAIHAFNVMNQGRKIYWESKSVPNMRLHCIFVAPPGGMKTYYLRQMAMDDYAIFKDCEYNISVKQNINEAGLVGTKTVQNGKLIEREGEAKKNANGILVVDEIRGLTEAFKASFNSQMDTQMLAALDHGNVSKSMAAGDIEYKTYFTMWGGVQPVRYDISGGMGRRMCYLLNIPDRTLNAKIRDAVWNSKNIRPDVKGHERLNESITAWTSSFNQINRIEFEHDIKDLYDNWDLQSYDTAGYDRLILGYHLAKYGADREVVLNVEDDELMTILKQQKAWRDDIMNGPDLIQVASLIMDQGKKIDDSFYIPRSDLNKICSTLSMSISNMHDKLEEMKKYGMISILKDGIVKLEYEVKSASV